MADIVDARGLTCPQPVLLTKKALETKDSITVLVDNTTALENVKRFAQNSGCTVEVKEETGGFYRLDIVKDRGVHIKEPSPEEISCDINRTTGTDRPLVVMITSDKMGIGDDELGTVLMRSFIHTLTEMETQPDVMIFYNSAVKLTIEGSDVLHDLKKIEEKGIKILVCGTCLNFFNIKEKLRIGLVSNMYDITETLLKAKKIVKP